MLRAIMRRVLSHDPEKWGTGFPPARSPLHNLTCCVMLRRAKAGRKRSCERSASRGHCCKAKLPARLAMADGAERRVLCGTFQRSHKAEDIEQRAEHPKAQLGIARASCDRELTLDALGGEAPLRRAVRYADRLVALDEQRLRLEPPRHHDHGGPGERRGKDQRRGSLVAPGLPQRDLTRRQHQQTLHTAVGRTAPGYAENSLEFNAVTHT